MPYNLDSRSRLLSPCNLNALGEWFCAEASAVENTSFRKVLLDVGINLASFVRWPQEALLLWIGCNRIPAKGARQRYHSYTDSIRHFPRPKTFTLDSRPNGPAIAAYCFAGGERPNRVGSSNKWSIHHVYSGKFPYPSRDHAPLHAAKEGIHFSQSAGLVAAHPIADALADEYPCFAWLLRAESFNRFGYDPEGVFAGPPDKFGFSDGREVQVIETEPPN